MKAVLKWLVARNKAIAALGAAIVVTASVLADGQVDASEWYILAAAWAAVVGVHQLPNYKG